MAIAQLSCIRAEWQFCSYGGWLRNPAPVENAGLSHYFVWVSTIQGGAGFLNHPHTVVFHYPWLFNIAMENGP